jgi:hypothetical protein
MQTDDMIKWGKKSGWPESLIYPYFADLGLSGTLRPDQRPDMLRLFDDLDSGKLDGGTIACWQENRPFRDETHIYYNQLVDKMLQHDVVLVVLSPRLYIYDMRDPFDKERLREKFKEAAEFIPKHIKGWLHPARERAAWEDDEWAGLGNLPPGFIADTDPKSETYKHLIPYWPHLEKVKEHFELYMQMGGELSLVYQHQRVSPIVFPEFGPEVDRVNVSKFKMSKYLGGGYYVGSRDGIVSMLTNPIYGGYRAVNGVIRRDEQGNKRRSFEPVIDQELLDFAYYRLAKTDLDGNPLAREGRKSRRFFQQESEGNYGLLKFRIKSNQGEVRTHANNHLGTGSYLIENSEEVLLHYYTYHADIPCDEIDTIVVHRLLEHVDELSQEQESIAEHEERVTARRNERFTKIKQIETSIADIDQQQQNLTARLGRISDERKQDLIEQQIDRLEIERVNLLRAKNELEKETDSDVGTLEEELTKLKMGWPKYDFKKRRSLINFAIQEVIIDVMSTRWMRVEVLWLHEEWGREAMYYRRKHGSMKVWSAEEKAILSEYYATMPKMQLMAALPNRAWASIQQMAGTRGLSRPQKLSLGETVKAKGNSYADLMFLQRENIPYDSTHTNWNVLSA